MDSRNAFFWSRNGCSSPPQSQSWRIVFAFYPNLVQGVGLFNENPVIILFTTCGQVDWRVSAAVHRMLDPSNLLQVRLAPACCNKGRSSPKMGGRIGRGWGHRLCSLHIWMGYSTVHGRMLCPIVRPMGSNDRISTYANVRMQ